jgi:Na+-transporting NADH:ubiquinone oxidoreductase subunit NqrC
MSQQPPSKASARAWLTVPAASLLLATGSLAALAPQPAFAGQYLTIEQAQTALFAEADRFEPRTVRLTPEQLKTLDGVAQVRQRGELRVIEAYQGNRLLGTIYIDDVIGKVEWITYAVAIGSDGTVRSLEVLEYRETHGSEIRLPGWRKQFLGRRADTPFHFGEDIKNISGATLSCSHLTAGVQRLLTLHQQLKGGKG